MGRAANKAVLRERHISPTIDDLIGALHSCTKFSNVDLRKSYHQLPPARESRYIPTFATHKGLFRYKRLNFGINAAAQIFQQTISEDIYNQHVG